MGLFFKLDQVVPEYLNFSAPKKGVFSDRI